MVIFEVSNFFGFYHAGKKIIIITNVSKEPKPQTDN
jgi:hypothetical protein